MDEISPQASNNRSIKNFLTPGLVVIGVLTLLFIGWLLDGNKAANTTQVSPTPGLSSSSAQPSSQNELEFSFANPKKSAHYESNTPSHGSVLEAAPINVVIDFNFDLAKPSAISINKEGKDYGVKDTVIDTNKLALRRAVDPSAPDGLYTVVYNACWPDGSCHDGSFQFAIDRESAKKAVDETGRNEVKIDLTNTSFVPKTIRIRAGTKITWTNSDNIEHYINTDSHPAHTYYPTQNSKALKKGDTYSLTFTEAGIYPYHCSAHADSMSGRIIVD